MNLPEPHVSAPTPRTSEHCNKRYREQFYALPTEKIDPARMELVRPSQDFARNLERENLWLREIVEKLKERVEDCDAVLHPAWSVERRANREALSSYNQLQQYLKDL